ncbi:unnamed protein product [Rotaria sp. Silwood2]|nr:unnamed protein product [Rotaria sp. Silwood2]CAF2715173.1 unnamed protein product [Rotaria sp. Silwood2]CAF2867110.1 unnamed protein product [Rotaria sp. Silwood2]CAF4080291.1 unnamed protein product [Rotaria sp. Silwood2]CAF4444283.1 unnamed protein product [Rotaria sp. Silwood2]
MCDRLCMAFSLKELQALIQLRDDGTMIGPNYVELGTKLKPIQTYNALRNSPCPVLLSEKHIYDGIPSNSTVLTIMQWGLLPSKEIEDKTKLKYRIANIKKEKLNKIKIFQTLLEKGHRCILVCEGFYQFVFDNKLRKQAYFIHLKNIFDKRRKCENIQPCYIAALFDTFQQSDGQVLYSFSIITVKTPTNLSHRIAPYMPAIFNSTEQVLDWIDFDRIDMNEALKLLENHEEHLVIDLVSNYVFKRSNTGPECIEVITKPTTEKPSTTNIESEDDIDIKIIDKHIEDIEQQHETELYQQKKRTLSKTFE